MSKTKVLTILVIALIGLNIITLSSRIWHKPPGNRAGPKQIIIDKLHLDEQQVQTYAVLIEEHKLGIEEKTNEMNLAKNALFECLKQDHDAEKLKLISRIGMLQSEIEHIHYQHFDGLKKICRPEQMADFNKLTEELAKLFAPEHQNRK
jgi:hypothetical protein